MPQHPTQQTVRVWGGADIPHLPPSARNVARTECDGVRGGLWLWEGGVMGTFSALPRGVAGALRAGWPWSCWPRCCVSGGISQRWAPAGPRRRGSCHTKPGGHRGSVGHRDPSNPPHDPTAPPTSSPPYHEGWQHRLRKASLEGVQQLLGAGVVEGQESCGHTWVGVGHT